MKFLKGMHRDTNPVDQPVGTWRYAKNIVIPPNSGSIQSEHGTIKVANISNGYHAVGSIVLHDDTVVIFSVRPDLTNPVTAIGTSEIGLFDVVSNSYTIIFNDSAQASSGQESLNFRRTHPIQGTYKIDSTNKVSIYWTDDNSEMKFIRLYNPPTTGTVFDLATLYVFPNVDKIPIIDFKTIIGGGLLTGAYTLAVAYVNLEGTPTNYINVSNTTYINVASENQAKVDVGYTGTTTNGFVSSGGSAAAYPGSSYGGNEGGIPTGKGISWDVSNLDPNYAFIRPAIILNVNGSYTAIRLSDKPYSSGQNLNITYTGTEVSSTELLDDIQIPRQSYIRAKTVAQVDDVLYWGNLVRKQPDINYQRYACNITIHAAEANPSFDDATIINGESVEWDVISAPGRDAEHTTKYKGYQRDEVYAFYITWVMNDGNETVAYHIPGRSADNIPAAYAIHSTSGTTLKENHRVDDVNGSTPIPATTESGDLNNPMIGKVTTRSAWGNATGMGYWENEGEDYPNNINYVARDKDGVAQEDLRNTPVRHHHFPSSALQEGSNHIYATTNSNNSDTVMNPLGFQVRNVAIPDELIGKVKAFKIYYAKREEINTTVVDTGVFNFTPSYHSGPSNSTWGYSETTYDTYSSYDNSISNVPVNGPCYLNFATFGLPCLEYMIQSPPDLGGSVVATPFSCTHAPYNDVKTTKWSGYLDRDDWAAKGECMTFNGLHMRVSDPDISGIDYIKITRHLRIGRTDDTNGRMAGVTILRSDETGLDYSSTNKISWFLDWTRMPYEHYASKTGNSLPGPDYDVVGIAPGKVPNIRSLKAKYNIKSNETVSIPGTSTNVNNIGGCQTTFLYANRPIWSLDMGRTVKNVYQTQNRATYMNCGPATSCFTKDMVNAALNVGLQDYDLFGNGAWDVGLQNFTVGGCGTTTYALSIGKPNGQGGNTWEEGWVIAEQWRATTLSTDTYQSYDQHSHIAQYHAYGGVHKYIPDVYSPFSSQYSLIYTGYTHDVSTINSSSYVNMTGTPTPASNADIIFGGDTFIDYYTETRHMQQEGWKHPQSGLWPATEWYTHYSYGYLGAVSGKTSTDYCQQMYITESKVNISQRYSLGNDNEDFYPLVKRESSKQNNNFVNSFRIFSYDTTMDSLNDIKGTIPFDHLNVTASIADYPTRIIRSVKHNREGLVDNFRTYKPEQYRDLPRNRGELWNLSSFDNVLLPILERSLLKTKGKEDLNLSDTSSVALGSGDLFENEPDEVLFTDRGYGGTLSQFSVATSRYGHFSVDKMTGKVFLLAKELEEVSNYGLKEFLLRRLTSWSLLEYGLPSNIDIPTIGIGIISTWDPKYARFILTKLDKMPTDAFISLHTAGDLDWNEYSRHFINTDTADLIDWDDAIYFEDASWTISYYPALKIWGSLHDFYPNTYFYTTTNFYGFFGSKLYEHNHERGSSLANLPKGNSAGVLYNIGRYYGVDYDIVFEYIDNEAPDDNKLYSNFYYTADIEVPSNDEGGVRHEVHDSGFDYFYVYNSHQLTGGATLIEPEGTNNQLWSTANVRRKERTWYVNGFRDDRNQSTLTANTTLDAPIDNPILSTNLLLADINIQLNSLGSKVWNTRRKFVDKWIAVRLVQNRNNDIASNTGKFLVTLHSAGASKRKTYR